MSKVIKRSIKCPKCQNESDFDIYQSINVTLDPSLKQKIEDASIFNFVCPNCGCATVISYETMYHDMENKVIVQLLNPNSITFDEFIENGGKQFFEYGYKIYGVGGINRFRELVSVIEDGYKPEVMLEIEKGLSSVEYEVNDTKIKPDAVLYLPKRQGTSEDKMKFELFFGNLFKTLAIPKKMYDDIASKVKEVQSLNWYAPKEVLKDK